MALTLNTECPICMDDIQLSLNSVTTECGHCFHTSCLMRNVAHNGFGCPYCRTIMAEIPKEEYDEENWNDEEIEYEEYLLRGFRLFFNNINGMNHDEDDIMDENEDEEEMEIVEERETIIKPSPAFIVKKLCEKGITMEHLVKIILNNDHEEYINNEDEFKLIDNEIFGKIRAIINNYDVNQEQIIVPGEAKLEPNIDIQIDNLAQPKISNNLNNHRRQFI